MFSKTLLKQTIRENGTFWLILTLVQALLLVTMGGTVPNVQMTAMTYYQLFPGILMGVYVIVTGNKLISQLVDKGTMAYVLSNPVKRTAVAFTQAVFFAGSLFFMFAIGAAAHIVSAYFAKGISAADAGLVIKLSLGLFVLSIAFSGIMFCASSIFNLSKHTTAVGGGLVGLFLLIPMVSMFGDNFKWLKYISLQSLYNPLGIVSDTDDFVWKFIVLAVVGIALYIAGSRVFAKRDLPL